MPQPPRVVGGDNATVRLGPESETQPDALLLVAPERGGQARVDERGFLQGAPEFAAEVAASSASYDLHIKKDVYAEYGVRKYLVWRVRDQAVDWFVLEAGAYTPLTPGSDGILRSRVFPGLWLDPQALALGNLPRVLEVLHEGLGSPEHAAFVERLSAS